VGTQLAKRDIRKAQKALGHKRIDTTAQHYVLINWKKGCIKMDIALFRETKGYLLLPRVC
jgi:hypothetical protein